MDRIDLWYCPLYSFYIWNDTALNNIILLICLSIIKTILMGLSSFLRLFSMRFAPWKAISYGGLNIRCRSRAYIVDRSRNICHVTNTNTTNPLKKQAKGYDGSGIGFPANSNNFIFLLTSGACQKMLRPIFCVILSAWIGFQSGLRVPWSANFDFEIYGSWSIQWWIWLAWNSVLISLFLSENGRETLS